jgi:hypothetical protein
MTVMSVTGPAGVLHVEDVGAGGKEFTRLLDDFLTGVE